MFNANVIHPVDYFNDTLISTQNKNIDDVFNQEIIGKSKIDISANKETADGIRILDKQINKLSRSANTAKGGMIFLRVFGAILFVVGVMLIVLSALKIATPLGA
ncbi:hypothetical protein FACS1894166_00510 [Bacilli bacterium]|nr:hypothetical protein FACS1894166_00510 [Bacilli bacterium]